MTFSYQQQAATAGGGVLETVERISQSWIDGKNKENMIQCPQFQDPCGVAVSIHWTTGLTF